jgi:predicted RNA methylase
MMLNNQEYWEKMYASKQSQELSWTQENPVTSLNFIHSFNLPKSASIIDIGGGDSKLVDCLLEEGYENITVLDISKEALNKAKKRLGKKANKVKWIVSDITSFTPETTYDVWHDRATFHFLTTAEEIKRYTNTAKKAVKSYFTIGTFSDRGPDHCSGLPVKRYSEDELTHELENDFKKIKCITEDHLTPSKSKQNFLFCSFQRVV